MKILFCKVILLTIGLSASCTHITMLGHKSAYDVNAEFSGDPIAPVSLNAGFEGRSFAAVPPREAVHWIKNLDPNKLPKGDVMSSLLELKIQKVEDSGQYGAVPFDYVTSGATGLAADALAGAGESKDLKANQAANIEKEKTNIISTRISEITASGDKAFHQEKSSIPR